MPYVCLLHPPPLTHTYKHALCVYPSLPFFCIWPLPPLQDKHIRFCIFCAPSSTAVLSLRGSSCATGLFSVPLPHLPHLRALDLGDTDVVSTDVVRLLNSYTTLRDLDVGGCRSLAGACALLCSARTRAPHVCAGTCASQKARTRRGGPPKSDGGAAVRLCFFRCPQLSSCPEKTCFIDFLAWLDACAHV